ncbi:hypothetical protein OF83DRAFT_1145872 [Amylostereum chailletii]|nr:hypothetical protein OF83DRAFT_1145872 [Amylostereum chailletii]
MKGFFAPECVWINHHKREVSAVLPQPMPDSPPVDIPDHQRDLEMAYKYWSFVESHPLHISLPDRARMDATGILCQWLSSHGQSSPFTRDEWLELINVLASESSNGSSDSPSHARIIARIFLRNCNATMGCVKDGGQVASRGPGTDKAAWKPGRRSIELVAVAPISAIISVVLSSVS